MPCEAFHEASLIFVGKAAKVVVSHEHERTATFTVTEIVKGESARTITLRGGGGDSCGVGFEDGKTYVVFAQGNYASGCGGTALLAEGQRTLAFARTAAKRTGTTLEGRVTVAERSDHPERANVEVRLRGTQVSTRTERDGFYRLAVPPGEHVLDVLDPAAVQTKPVTVTGSREACMHRDLSMTWNGRVHGRVRGADGKPIAGVTVRLFGAAPEDSYGVTDANGDYEFRRLSLREYSVGIERPEKPLLRMKPFNLSQSVVVQKIDVDLR
jgi:Carboxypeptidase regulatory-like domain